MIDRLSTRYKPFNGQMLDVISLYKIYRTRLNCMRINSSFAKELVLNNFTYIVNFYKSSIDSKRLFRLYLYLYSQAQILDIPSEWPQIKSSITTSQ